MLPLFAGVTLVNLLCLAVTMTLGYGALSGSHWGAYHQLAGALATITCCAVHCIVFTYFIATAKWARHAVTVRRLDPALIAPTRSFKAQAFPAALLAITSVFAAAISGAATYSYQIRPTLHHALAIAALAINVMVAFVEYRAIARNGRLIDKVLARVGESSGSLPARG